jgi:hypothetical protein
MEENLHLVRRYKYFETMAKHSLWEYRRYYLHEAYFLKLCLKTSTVC